MSGLLQLTDREGKGGREGAREREGTRDYRHPR